MNRQRLEQLARLWQRQIFLRAFLFALAALGLAEAVDCWHPEFFRWQVLPLVYFGTLGALLAGSQPWQLDAAQLGRHLDRTYPELEESAALFLRPLATLTLLERMQLGRVRRLPVTASFGAPPRNFLKCAVWTCLVGLCLGLSSTIYFARGSGHRLPTAHRLAMMAPPGPTPSKRAVRLPKLVENVFTITPPAYTGRPVRRVDGFAIEAEEGSTLDWSIILDGPVTGVRLAAGSTVIPLRPTGGGRSEGRSIVGDPALFALLGTLPDGTPWSPPELFSVKVIKDHPPTVQFVQPASARTEMIPPISGPVSIEAIIKDDYAVAEAHLIATVAKGSGEAVKFREQHISFDPDTAVETPLARRFTKSLDLTALGMEPGDELYFFVEASDNRQPTANRTRSETRFLSIRGPDEKKTSVGLGVAGINLVPQYFRSERQLIIDTEKLVADRPSLADTEFRSRANDLGEDQALLRLRYGRFLGEDKEESPLTDHLETHLDPLQSAVPTTAPGPRAAASIAQRFQQEHIEQDREGGGDGTGLRSPVDGAPLTATQIRQPFVDSHDQHDKNTFFDHETKGTMRDALSAMWEAEGALRTTRPPEALAPEHRALDILKALQQSDRAYVQHVGFEAAPLKLTERRLKGESTDVPPRAVSQGSLPTSDPELSKVRAALADLTQTSAISAATLDEVEPALTTTAARQPDDFLPGLQALRQLRVSGTDPKPEHLALQRALFRLLPRADSLPARDADAAPSLAAPYFEALQRGETMP